MQWSPSLVPTCMCSWTCWCFFLAARSSSSEKASLSACWDMRDSSSSRADTRQYWPMKLGQYALKWTVGDRKLNKKRVTKSNWHQRFDLNICPHKCPILTQFKDLQRESEEARAGGIGVILTRGRANFIWRWQEQQEWHFLSKLQYFLAVDAEILCLYKDGAKRSQWTWGD